MTCIFNQHTTEHTQLFVNAHTHAYMSSCIFSKLTASKTVKTCKYFAKTLIIHRPITHKRMLHLLSSFQIIFSLQTINFLTCLQNNSYVILVYECEKVNQVYLWKA